MLELIGGVIYNSCVRCRFMLVCVLISTKQKMPHFKIETNNISFLEL